MVTKTVRETEDKLTFWTVYQHPKDFPQSWVVRPHDVPGGPRVECFVCNSLLEARMFIPPGLVRLARYEDDEPQIYETWF